MKNILIIIFCLPTFLLAQAPQGFTYQGVATNNEGIEISNQDISIRVSILAETASGNSVYLETHLTTTDAFGLFNVVIGSGQTESDFSTIDWGSSAHFLKIELDINGGSEYIHIGTQQMMSVPYALHAENAGLDSAMVANMINQVLENNVNDLGNTTTIDSLSQLVSNLDSLMQIITPFFGCTDPTACNYDSTSIIDNGTCSGLIGCTDNQSSNYNASATCDDGSCIPYVGMYGFGGVVYKVNSNNAWIINIHEEISSSNHASSVNNYINSLTTNGYNDWDLPTHWDWDDICSQKFLINIVASQNGGLNLTNNNYMRSSQWCTISNIPYLASYSVSSCAETNYTGNCSQTFLVRSIRQITF